LFAFLGGGVTEGETVKGEGGKFTRENVSHQGSGGESYFSRGERKKEGKKFFLPSRGACNLDVAHPFYRLSYEKEWARWAQGRISLAGVRARSLWQKKEKGTSRSIALVPQENLGGGEKGAMTLERQQLSLESRKGSPIDGPIETGIG